MKKLLMTVFVVLFAFSTTMAQDWQVVKESTLGYSHNDGPTAGFFLDANTGWLVGEGGRVQKTTDGGANWTTLQQPDGLLGDWVDVEFADADTGYACAGGGFIYKTTDGGSSWNMVGDTANYVVDLKGLSVVSADIVYFCGKGSTLLKTNDGGSVYTKSDDTAFNSEDLDGGISFIDENQGVVISDSKYGDSWYTHDGGGTWNYVNVAGSFSSLAFLSKKLYDIGSAGDSTFVIVGYHNTALVSNDGGKNYHFVGDSTAAYVYYNNVAVVSEDAFYVSSSEGFIVKFTGGGQTVDTLYTGSGQTPTDIIFVDANTGYAILAYGQWFKTTNGGYSWAPVLEWPSVSFQDITAAGTDKLVAVSWGGGEVTFSEEAVANWSYPVNDLLEYLDANLYVCSFVDENNGFIAGGGATLARTTDGGASWNFIATPMQAVSNGNFYTVDYLTSDIVYAGGTKGHIYKSTNDGLTWMAMNYEGGGDILDIFPVSETEIYVSGKSGEVCSYNAAIDSFKIIADDGSYYMRDIEFRSGVGLLVRASGRIYSVSDTGIDSLFQDPDKDDLYDIEFITDDLVYVVGEAGKIYKSGDAGQTWIQETSGTEETLISCEYVGSQLWVVGQNGTILKKSVSASIDVNDNKTPSTFALKQNYPNPFNPTTTISFDLPEAANVQLVIYNMMGQQVAELKNENMQPGFYKMNFNASHLASGVYIYRIQANNFAAIKKMTILK